MATDEGRNGKRLHGNRFTRIVEAARNMTDEERLQIMVKAGLTTQEKVDEALRSKGKPKS